MKQNTLQFLLRSTLAVLLALACLNISAQRFPIPSTAKKCRECGKPLTSCPYKGKHPYINGHAYVDLGLPSGTLWATCNVGATSPEQYGNYFAWGETSPKRTYTWENYKFRRGDSYFTKYSCGFGPEHDNKEVLDLMDDVAHVSWGGSWHMPTVAQMEELKDRDYCTWTWTKLNGREGYHVKSKRNGKSIFLPAAGRRHEGTFEGAGEYGYYWTRICNRAWSHRAYDLPFCSETVFWCAEGSGSDRYEGKSVRAVVDRYPR